ncbi:MAG: hypothetical protein K9G48_01735 [Reyranella sp.]|nr:hypothetical protein [Reyranella sp.]
MATAVLIKHRPSGLIRKGYYGFSWTYLFFGWFVPVFRGELGVGALHLLFSIVTFGLWQFIVCFLYNRQFMTRMLTNGWILADSEARNAGAALALGVAMPVAARQGTLS